MMMPRGSGEDAAMPSFLDLIKIFYNNEAMKPSIILPVEKPW
jgi:hypothetical protein